MCVQGIYQSIKGSQHVHANMYIASGDVKFIFGEAPLYSSKTSARHSRICRHVVIPQLLNLSEMQFVELASVLICCSDTPRLLSSSKTRRARTLGDFLIDNASSILIIANTPFCQRSLSKSHPCLFALLRRHVSRYAYGLVGLFTLTASRES